MTCVNIEICAIRVICERLDGLTLVNLLREIEGHLLKSKMITPREIIQNGLNLKSPLTSEEGL